MAEYVFQPRLKRHFSLVAHSPDVVELRYGVWHSVNFTVTDDTNSGHLYGILRRLDGTLSSAEIAAAENIDEAEVDEVCARLDELGVLENQSRHALDYYIDEIARNLRVQEAKTRTSPTAVQSLTDDALSRQVLSILAGGNLRDQYQIFATDPSRVADVARLSRAAMDDVLEFELGAAAFAELSGRLVVFGQRTVEPIAARTFNRVSLRHRIPWIHAAIDGPYLLIGPTFIPARTACYECLETRVVRNLRDAESYIRYKNALADGAAQEPSFPLGDVLVPIVASLTAFEALNVLTTGTTFTEGRMLSVYLPTLEFSFHAVLRVPDCAACGSLTERDARELYFDVTTLLKESPEGGVGPGWS